MTFSYNDKEIKLIILMEEAGKTIPPQENQKLENNVQTPSQNKHIPVINENNMENKNTLLEINL